MNNTMVPVSEAKARLAELIREAAEHDVLLLRHGRPAAVLMSADRHSALLEQLDDALDRLSVHDAPGVTMSYDKLAAELGLGEPA